MPDHVEMPAHAFFVRLKKGRTREVDLRLVRLVELRAAERQAFLHFVGGADPLEILFTDAERAMRAWRTMQERKAAESVESVSGENLDEHRIIEAGNMGVYSWTPERDGKGKPEQVHFYLDVTIAGMECKLIKRHKSRGAVDRLIDALVKHREDVWPTV